MNPPIIQHGEDGPLYRRADIAWLPPEMVEWVKRWPCPEGCSEGVIPHGPTPDGEWESQQCQFCYERARILEEVSDE